MREPESITLGLATEKYHGKWEKGEERERERAQMGRMQKMTIEVCCYLDRTMNKCPTSILLEVY